MRRTLVHRIFGLDLERPSFLQTSAWVVFAIGGPVALFIGALLLVGIADRGSR